MRRAPGGYTIIEVMIFLAVSAVLLIAGMKIISGKQDQVDFNQKVRDTQSQLQTWAGSIASGYTGGDPTQQHCDLANPGPRPVILPGSPSSVLGGYTPKCVFLGMAIQFPDNNASTIYAYSVFGTLLDNSGQIPTSLNDSNPEPAVGRGGGQSASSINLTQSFSLAPLYVIKVTSSGKDLSGNPVGPNSNRLIGFYGSLNSFTTSSQGAANAQSDTNAYLYNFPSGQAADQSPNDQAKKCLEMSPSCGYASPLTNPYPDLLDNLKMCLTDGSRYAEITIDSNNGFGADVTLNYLNSAANC